MTFGQIERPMFVELFGPMPGLENQWQKQSASEQELNLTAFNWDHVPYMNCGGNTGLRTDKKPETIKETNEFIIQKDALGRTTKLYKNVSTLPLPLDYPVKDMETWQKIKPMYQFDEKRIDWHTVEYAKTKQSEGTLIIADIPGGFHTPRELMGEEKACLCYYEDQELMHDIIDTIKDTSLKVIERITAKLTIDQISVHEDLAGKSGPLPGPSQVKEYLKPYFSTIWDLASSRGTKIFSMDTDGNVDTLIDILIQSGINLLLPCEPCAGMDIVELRKKYGNKIAFKGGIDKFVLRQTKEKIKKELEYKMQPLMQKGGIAFGLDHRILDGTPLENYRYYVDLGREILGIPPRTPGNKGWERMAF
jgi:uroporphyrinogen-III decarboxylase